MAITAEIIFVGLVSFLNVRDQNVGTDMPPPSAIVLKATGHQTFIAFDNNKVSMTGAAAAPVGGSAFSSIAFDAVGDELSFNDDRTVSPQVDETFDSVARFNV